MALNQCYITANEIELLSFLKQNIIRKLCEEAAKQNKDKTDPWVIRAIVEHFNMGLTPHGVFNLVHSLAHLFLGEFLWFSVHVTPHVESRSVWGDQGPDWENHELTWHVLTNSLTICSNALWGGGQIKIVDHRLKHLGVHHWKSQTS